MKNRYLKVFFVVDDILWLFLTMPRLFFQTTYYVSIIEFCRGKTICICTTVAHIIRITKPKLSYLRSIIWNDKEILNPAKCFVSCKMFILDINRTAIFQSNRKALGHWLSIASHLFCAPRLIIVRPCFCHVDRLTFIIYANRDSYEL